jgi:fibrillarin-like pre-rRNA processing protein
MAKKINESQLIETEFNNVYKLSGISSEKLLTISNEEFHIWDPYHSKLAAIILKGSSLPVKKDSIFLYLGAANGTTVSHVSDIVENGIVYAVEFSPRAMKDLIRIRFRK